MFITIFNKSNIQLAYLILWQTLQCGFSSVVCLSPCTALSQEPRLFPLHFQKWHFPNKPRWRRVVDSPSQCIVTRPIVLPSSLYPGMSLGASEHVYQADIQETLSLSLTWWGQLVLVSLLCAQVVSFPLTHCSVWHPNNSIIWRSIHL